MWGALVLGCSRGQSDSSNVSHPEAWIRRACALAAMNRREEAQDVLKEARYHGEHTHTHQWHKSHQA